MKKIILIISALALFLLTACTHKNIVGNGDVDNNSDIILNQFGNKIIYKQNIDEQELSGANHQKLVIIDNEIAFCRGIDLAKGRWNRRYHESAKKNYL